MTFDYQMVLKKIFSDVQLPRKFVVIVERLTETEFPLTEYSLDFCRATIV
jgi:hypothetical protein